MEIKINLEREDRDYKHVVRYREEFNPRVPPVLNYIYIKKYALSDPPPATLTMTLSTKHE